MLFYLARRLSLAVLTLLVILSASYFLLRLAPGDPARTSVFGETGGTGESLSAEKSALAKNRSIEQQLHLDKPIWMGFLLWIKNVSSGDLGYSVSVDKGRPVVHLILERLPVTVFINVLAVLVTYFIAIPIGLHSAIFPDSCAGKIVVALLFLLYSIPAFWMALLLQALLCEGGIWPFFPLKGIADSSSVGMSTWEILWSSATHYVLPVFCLSYAGLAGLSRYARAGMLDIIGKEYIRTARAKGLSEAMVIFKHALRNSVITLITIFAGLLPGLVGGSIIIEYVFSIPGMGMLSMMALTSRDIPLLMALFGFGGVLTLAGILLSDVLYVAVDPRITFDSR